MEYSILSHNKKEYTVSEFSILLKRSLELNYNSISIKGEISGLKIVSSGHTYFSIKDSQAVLSAVCWRGVNNKLSVKLEEGLEVICTGTVTIFSGQSKYQIIVDKVELAGIGSLMLLLEKRKKLLESEGLFDQIRKKKIPFFPKTIGVITSFSGAVIKDILHRIEDRCPARILLWPVAVQGENAAEQITKAINGFNNIQNNNLVPDVIIIARGGGSIEDLWAFNEEIVIRATAYSKIPIISAIGHETDVTLIDFASDLRAPTPTAAAEFAVPVLKELFLKIFNYQTSLCNQIFQNIKNKKNYLDALKRGLTSPSFLLMNIMQKFDDLISRLNNNLFQMFERQFLNVKKIYAPLLSFPQKFVYYTNNKEEIYRRLNFGFKNLIALKSHQFGLIESKFTIQTFQKDLKLKHIIINNINLKLMDLTNHLIQLYIEKLSNLFSLLKCFSCQETLERGYVIMMTEGNKIIDTKAKFDNSQQIKVFFKDGKTKFIK